MSTAGASPFARLVTLALLLAGLVVGLGVWVRLSHAGLGCPDWPGCYGSLVVPEPSLARVHADYAARPLEEGKAWKEMIHRYAAGLLGFLVMVLTVLAWRVGQLRGTAAVLLVLVIFQALLGMWTVTLLLKPLVVVAHLLGGMCTLSLLFWMWLAARRPVSPMPPAAVGQMLRPAWFGLAVVAAQIALGGWTSSNYAALICADFPTCQGQWWPAMDFREGFRPWRGLGVNYEGGVLPADARTAIHVAHRIGAVFVLLVVGGIAIGCLRRTVVRVRRIGTIMLCLLCLQWGLGISNVLLRLPLWIATGHGVVAALLLLTLVALLHCAYEGRRVSPRP